MAILGNFGRKADPISAKEPATMKDVVAAMAVAAWNSYGVLVYSVHQNQARLMSPGLDKKHKGEQVQPRSSTRPKDSDEKIEPLESLPILTVRDRGEGFLEIAEHDITQPYGRTRLSNKVGHSTWGGIPTAEEAIERIEAFAQRWRPSNAPVGAPRAAA